jgi:hypothetical protein
MDKLGKQVDPFKVVVNGSKEMHAVWEGLAYNKTDLTIASLDAPIVTVDTPSPIVFLKELPIQGNSMHFNLFNNVRRAFRQTFTLEDAIGSHVCSLEANIRVTTGIPLPLACALLLPVGTETSVQLSKQGMECKLPRVGG